MVFDSLEKDQFRLWSQNRLSTINPWRGQALSINRTASCHILCGSSDGTCSRLKQVKAGETWQCGAYQTGWVFVLAYCLPFCKPLNRCKGWMRGNLVFLPPGRAEYNPNMLCLIGGKALQPNLFIHYSCLQLHLGPFRLWGQFVQTLPFSSYCRLSFYLPFPCSISECPFWLPHTFFRFFSQAHSLQHFSLPPFIFPPPSTGAFASLYLFAFASPPCLPPSHSAFSVRSLLVLWEETLPTQSSLPPLPPAPSRPSYDDMYLQVMMREAGSAFDQCLGWSANKR